MIQFALLALLREGPDYGYRLRRRFEREVGSSWCLNMGQVYQSLQTLERKGLVEEKGEAAACDRGPGRNRRTYALTEKGARSLERWLRRVPTRPKPRRDEMLLRLLGAARDGAASVRPLVAASERAHRDRLERALAERRHVGSAASAVARLGLDAEIAHLETYLGWLDLCRRVLVDGEPTAPAPLPAVRTEPRAPARAAAPRLSSGFAAAAAPPRGAVKDRA